MNTKKIHAKKISGANPLIGFIGQGFVGKAYADDFERRGHNIVRYSLEAPYRANKEKIKDCDIVFIAVPTPTTENKFDDSIVREAVSLVGKGKIAVIKSTVVPGTTVSIQKQYPNVFVVHSPEFLREARAAYDAGHPDRNIIGVPIRSAAYEKKAKEVLAVLPFAPFRLICDVNAAELVKYAGNVFLYLKVLLANLFYDVASELGIDWDVVRKAVAADPRIGASHLVALDQKGRGAGGHCFIKDFAAFAEVYKETVGDRFGAALLNSLRDKNGQLLVSTKKDLDLLAGVYGADFLKRFRQK